MTFTFQDDYEVLTSSDARRALDLLDEKAPVAVVLSDQRMPNMSGVEFVTEVCKRHPATVRMILTGFADMRAIIEAINDGHVYAYITKPWEPDHLKQVMKQAVEHYNLTVENERLVAGLSRANLFLEAVMDHLDTGALAVDAAGVIQAVNRPAREYLALEGDLRGKRLEPVLEKHGLEAVGKAADALADDRERTWVDVEVRIAQRGHRLRITMHKSDRRRRRPLRARDPDPRDLARADATPLRRPGGRHRGLPATRSASGSRRRAISSARWSPRRRSRASIRRGWESWSSGSRAREPRSRTGSTWTTRSRARTSPTRSCCRTACASR